MQIHAPLVHNNNPYRTEIDSCAPADIFGLPLPSALASLAACGGIMGVVIQTHKSTHSCKADNCIPMLEMAVQINRQANKMLVCLFEFPSRAPPKSIGELNRHFTLNHVS